MVFFWPHRGYRGGHVAAGVARGVPAAPHSLVETGRWQRGLIGELAGEHHHARWAGPRRGGLKRDPRLLKADRGCEDGVRG